MTLHKYMESLKAPEKRRRSADTSQTAMNATAGDLTYWQRQAAAFGVRPMANAGDGGVASPQNMQALMHAPFRCISLVMPNGVQGHM